MARKPRIEFEGAFYHVIVRGNQRQKIFRDERDYKKYLEILSGYKKQYHYRLFAYVLMSNHIHLLIETKDTPLSKIQQGINQRYTMYFNSTYKTMGHLFQGRYKAILCDKDTYLLSLIKYIHLNPVRAKMSKLPEDYKWSSHRNYSKKSKDDMVDIDQVLRMFSAGKSQARKLYRDFMNDGINIKKEDIYRTVDQRILGDEHFIESIADKTEEGIQEKRRMHEYSLEEITKAIETVAGITVNQMRKKGKGRGISLGRKLMSLAANECGYKGREVAKYLRKDPAVITRYLKEKSNLKKEAEKIFKLLNVNTQV